ncbi:ABC transporter [Achromatium sp. WMS1]|nr:ABC transporter [Achromatium sp. WMS1]
MNLNWALIFDPLFRIPWVAGIIVAILLPTLGTLLRLRGEWLAALGLAHITGFSALLGLAIGAPAVLGAISGALVGAIIKNFGQFKGNTIYALMILFGWSATLLIAANTALGSVMGHALTEGQLYFANEIHLLAAFILAMLIILMWPWLAPKIIRSRLFPGHENANLTAAWRWHLGFDTLIALGMAIGTTTIGLMGAFALIFIPPWLAFRCAANWRTCLWISISIGVSAYLGAFISALLFDQPFGPVLVAWLLFISGLFSFFL